MNIEELELPGVFLITPNVYGDLRGSFTELLSQSQLQGVVGEKFDVAQVNTSVSKLNTVRGIHTASTPPGQAKYVSCLYGSVLDVVVDLRPESESYGNWISIELIASNFQSVLIPEGMGHGFRALSDNAVVNYLCNQPYAPDREFGITPFDRDLNIDWGITMEAAVLSEKDIEAPIFSSDEIQQRLRKAQK